VFLPPLTIINITNLSGVKIQLIPKKMARQEGYKIAFAMQGSKDPLFPVPMEHQAFSLL
jgi:hypothetical protein